jgi:hypothetical protein
MLLIETKISASPPKPGICAFMSTRPRDEAKQAANEAKELLIALFRVTQLLRLSPEHTACAVLDLFTSTPKAPHWWAALARLHVDGEQMLQPPKDPQRRLHS